MEYTLMSRRIDTDVLAIIVAREASFAGVCRALGKAPVGGNLTHFSKRCQREGIDTSHFTSQAHNRGKPSKKKLSSDHYLILGAPTDYRQKGTVLTRCLIESGTPYECAKCQLSEWLGQSITLEVDHINNKYWDNRKANLQFLCPNCHSTK